ncbi:hypothetical protein ASC59_12925 [Leifsonia sp. Root1293]|nr:hypothetical protein ASC59_12925 [Leifsonia sp. Root1293]KRA08747.1 hypothetical protein ASD61_12925 [Leifsonia sp. Root60]
MISGGGSTAVATDELFALAARLHAIAASAEHWVDALGTLGWLAPRGMLAGTFAAAGSAAGVVAADAKDIAGALDRSAEGYGEMERRGVGLQQAVGSLLGWVGGFLAVGMLPALAWGAGLLAVDVVLAWFFVQGANRLLGRPVDDPADWLERNARALNSPGNVALVRMLVASVDDAAGGVVRLPYPLARALGDAGLDVLGVGSSAFGITVLGGLFGAVRETDVRIDQVRADGSRLPTRTRRGAAIGPTPGVAVAAPSTVSELLARVPTAAPDLPQVRVERYGTEDAPHWVAYIGGTVSWEVAGSSEPWDLTSNVHAVAGPDSGSYRAVLDALDQAGVREGDRVVAVGHSQGGLLAAQLASDPRYSAAGLVTAGAPIAQLAVPADVPTLQLEHSDDIVPALGGYGDADPSPEHLIARREYLANRLDPVDGAMPAHGLDSYRETATAVDASEEPRLVALRERLTAAIAGGAGAAGAAGQSAGPASAASGTATWWRGERR